MNKKKPTTPDTFRGRVVCKVSDFIVNNGTHTSIIMTWPNLRMIFKAFSYEITSWTGTNTCFLARSSRIWIHMTIDISFIINHSQEKYSYVTVSPSWQKINNILILLNFHFFPSIFLTRWYYHAECFSNISSSWVGDSPDRGIICEPQIRKKSLIIYILRFSFGSFKFRKYLEVTEWKEIN